MWSRARCACRSRRSTPKATACRRKRLAGGVGRIVVDVTELDLVPKRRTERSLHDARVDLIVGIRNDAAVAILVALLRTVGAAREQFRFGREARGGKCRADAARSRAAHRMSQHAPAFADPEHILDVLGAERRDTTNRAGAEHVGHRPANDVDAADELRLEIEDAVGVVAAALEILPRAVDDDVDAAEVLKAADIDRGARIVGPLLHVDTRHAVDQIRRFGRHELVDLILANRTHAGEGLGRRHRIIDRRRADRDIRGWRRLRCRRARGRRANGAHAGRRHPRSLHRFGRHDGDRVQLHVLHNLRNRL